jgi:hypothetical protein
MNAPPPMNIWNFNTIVSLYKVIMASCGCYEAVTAGVAASNQIVKQSVVPIVKPENWNTWPMYKKIRYYGTQMTELNGIYADKLMAKDIIETFISSEDLKVAPVIRILDSPTDITDSDICSNWILKSTHACGWNIDLQTVETPDVIIPILTSWNKPYFRANAERQYKFIQPRFFVEEKIVDKYKGKTAHAYVYMVRCIYGKAYTIGVLDRKAGFNLLYDTDWNQLIPSKQSLEKPVNLEKMLELSEKLSAMFEFVRIDFYIGEHDELYFSEFTFTPAGGNRVFSEELELLMGEPWV